MEFSAPISWAVCWQKGKIKSEGFVPISRKSKIRAEIAEKVLTIFKHDCDNWGIHVERVEVKSLVVAREMMVPMAREAKAAREANGLVIIQRGEKNCLKKIRIAADEMEDNPTAITLKYLQVKSNKR